MLRKNAWATHLCPRAIEGVFDADDDAIDAILEALLGELFDMLPNESARRSLRREKGGAPDLASEWIRVNGLGNWFGALVRSPLYPRGWWGSESYPDIVEEYCALIPDLQIPTPSASGCSSRRGISQMPRHSSCATTATTSVATRQPASAGSDVSAWHCRRRSVSGSRMS